MFLLLKNWFPKIWKTQQQLTNKILKSPCCHIFYYAPSSSFLCSFPFPLTSPSAGVAPRPLSPSFNLARDPSPFLVFSFSSYSPQFTLHYPFLPSPSWLIIYCSSATFSVWLPLIRSYLNTYRPSWCFSSYTPFTPLLFLSPIFSVPSTLLSAFALFSLFPYFPPPPFTFPFLCHSASFFQFLCPYPSFIFPLPLFLSSHSSHPSFNLPLFLFPPFLLPSLPLLHSPLPFSSPPPSCFSLTAPPPVSFRNSDSNVSKG